MTYLHRTHKPVFTSGREVIAYYTRLIDELIPQLQHVTPDDEQTLQIEIANLRQQLVRQLKNFSLDRVDEYFGEMMANAKSDQEYYHLSNAYETILLAELSRIKEKLHTLRTT